jgi:ribonucleoside-diphosphate reductase alpha chain
LDGPKLRPKGAKLKTFGGRSSGPEPLKQLFEFIINLFKNAAGRKLHSIECHDICCMIASCVVVGGVRRSAGISLSNLSDTRMRHAKDGDFWTQHKHRFLSNNSAAYTEKPEMSIFLDEWVAIMKNGNGERGIVNREGLKKACDAIGRDSNHDLGLNPCGEVILRPEEFCNLTETVARRGDTLEQLKKKVRNATILGTLQSTLTDFNFLRERWKRNCDEERLLGVSITGTRDHEVLQRVSEESRMWLRELRKVVRETNDRWADYLGIPRSKACTVVKPSGTVSQLVNCASGLHSRYADFYIRRVRVTKNDPVAALLRDYGITCNPEVGEDWSDFNTLVFEFPVKTAGGSVTRNDTDVLEQLEYWKMFKTEWCDHNPSVTIYIKDNEWLKVGAWVYENWDFIGGISFLPHDGGTYELPPYEEIDEETYNKLASTFPQIDFSRLSEFEKEDATIGSQELACSGGACELR